MFSTLRTKISSFAQLISLFDLSFFFLLSIGAYFYKSDTTLFVGFISGNIFCISFEIALFWRYILYQIHVRKRSSDIKAYLSNFFKNISQKI